VIRMRVGVYDCTDWTVAQVGVGQLHAGSRCRLDCQGIDDDPTCVAGDEGDVGYVVPSGLPDAGGNLEEAVDRIELRLALQGGMYGLGVLAPCGDK
jgi:hypothetical protein